MTTVNVRLEQSSDEDAIRRVNKAAFGQPDEADLVDRLRAQVPAYLGLVATRGGEVVGHIAFTPVTLAPPQLDLYVYGLAPMAVLPAHQRTGIGTALVREGLVACRRAGGDAVVVLGHPDYYPRFGFASVAALVSEYDVPPEAFMALALTPRALEGVAGVARYHAAFGG